MSQLQYVLITNFKQTYCDYYVILGKKLLTQQICQINTTGPTEVIMGEVTMKTDKDYPYYYGNTGNNKPYIDNDLLLSDVESQDELVQILRIYSLRRVQTHRVISLFREREVPMNRLTEALPPCSTRNTKTKSS